MKIKGIPLALLFLLINTSGFYAQATGRKTILQGAVITMKQMPSSGWGGGVNSDYTLTFSAGGNVIFDGLDEGKAISKREPPIKVLRKYRISQKQLQELVDEFYKINFFSLDDTYCCRDNGDGTSTIIRDGSLATVIISLAVDGKIKTVTNINFAPEKLIELQRKLYNVGGVASFVKSPPYWLSLFPNERFPPRNAQEITAPAENRLSKITYRKIQRASPKGGSEKRIDLVKTWGFITPCTTTKTQVEKLLGRPISDDGTLTTYNFKTDKISVFYSTVQTNLCGDDTKIGTVILFSVIPIKDIKLSELKIDLSGFRKSEGFRGREFTYNDQDAGLFIETEVVEFSDKTLAEMVTSIQFSKNFNNRKTL